MKSILEVLNLSAEYLKKKGIKNPRRQAEEVLSDALGIKRLQLYLQFDRPLDDHELEISRHKIMRRGQGEPAQYIHGEVEFYNCRIKVTPDVLIPRPETELLVDMIVKDLVAKDLSEKVLWDLCCGSGCIGIALKKRLPQLNVVLSDVSSDAIKIARENATYNNVEVHFLEGDLLAPFNDKKANFAVCNPPYISQDEYEKLDCEVKNFEPIKALVAGPTGLEFYERLAKEIKEYLQPGAKMWMEIGYLQGNSLLHLFSQPPFKNCRIEKDLSGHDRFLSIALMEG